MVLKAALLMIEKETKNHFSKRIDILLEQRGCTKMWLATQLGISRQALNYILKHNKKPKYVSEIATLFNINPNWLETGYGQMSLATTPNTRNTLIKVYRLEQLETTEPLSALEYLEQITGHTEESHAFAIRLEKYPAMSNKFKEDSILIFDRAKKPKDGDFVLAKEMHKTKMSVIFREMKVNKKVMMLCSTSEKYKPIPFDQSKHEILGTLIEIRSRF